MTKISSSEAYDMVSLFKGLIREIAKDETPKIMQDKTLTYDEKYKKIIEIENECIDRTAKFEDVNEDFILNLHKLLSSYKQGDIDRRRAYRNFLSEYINGSIEKTFDLMDTELLEEYDHAIKRHKFLIQRIKENK
ncbi:MULTISPECIES: hypothetical protein [Staphylococcus]|uniref:Uncharacterized protein n=1 Tax=Staphylococcus saprophyticus subsp. saprophyticus MS1146 TaxID=881952 RepID=F4MSP2_STASA|nr:hypothetical protein [Staphylococcus saprophyticus]MDW4330450.1 hypothetical protein [Staphylococcus saprophyticus]MDW4458821.1 hypothetical protein [Staphylococcus saprophyticus]NJE84224.1 hypothetical protein [Staphylococcus saprophyticus]OEK33133.1 hypothetical protein ASS87_08235 [Staphylococcus saprophyticus]CBW54920.1 hypothetical protein SSAP_P105 [Staphylococcus saprophyticus subsp. saprophyticus MS1146]